MERTQQGSNCNLFGSNNDNNVLEIPSVTLKPASKFRPTNIRKVALFFLSGASLIGVIGMSIMILLQLFTSTSNRLSDLQLSYLLAKFGVWVLMLGIAVQAISSFLYFDRSYFKAEMSFDHNGTQYTLHSDCFYFNRFDCFYFNAMGRYEGKMRFYFDKCYISYGDPKGQSKQVNINSEKNFYIERGKDGSTEIYSIGKDGSKKIDDNFSIEDDNSNISKSDNVINMIKKFFTDTTEKLYTIVQKKVSKDDIPEGRVVLTETSKQNLDEQSINKDLQGV